MGAAGFGVPAASPSFRGPAWIAVALVLAGPAPPGLYSLQLKFAEL